MKRRLLKVFVLLLLAGYLCVYKINAAKAESFQNSEVTTEILSNQITKAPESEVETTTELISGDTTTESATNEETTTENVTDVETTSEVEPTTKEVKNGFYKRNGKTQYYKNGILHKGFLTLKNKKYYFDSKGYMVTGSKKIGGARYYFKKTGVMTTGFVKIKSKKYYYSKKSGKRLYGYRKIGKYRYYLKGRSGAVYSGFITMDYKKSKVLRYFDKKGRLKTGKFKVSTVEYRAREKSGEIYSVKNLVDVICQRPQLPTGCEITSWTMMANYAGVKISKTTAANVMPKSSDPNQGFMGSPYSSGGRGLVVYPNGLRTMTNKYLGSFENMSGCASSKIKSKLRKKHPVIVWVAPLDGFYSHTVLLTGYDETGYFYNDPWTGTKRKISYQYFKTIWRGNAYRAMSY